MAKKAAGRPGRQKSAAPSGVDQVVLSEPASAAGDTPRASRGSLVQRFRTPLIVTALLTALAVQAVLSMRLMSASSDETEHLTAGYTYFRVGEIRLNPQHPPLIKLLAAAPLAATQPRMDLTDPNWTATPPRAFQFAMKFLYSNDADKLLFWGRMPVVCLSVLLGLYVYLWARELFGPASGALALLLYCFCPNIIAHSRFVTMDLGLSCFFLITLYYLWSFLRKGGIRYLIATGIALGLALAAKFSAVILLPIVGLLLLLGFAWPSGLAPFLNTQEGEADQKRRARSRDVLVAKPIDGRLKLVVMASVVIFVLAAVLLYVIYLFPRDPLFYWKGMMRVNADHIANYDFFLWGDFEKHRFWYYFLAAFLIKTPVPTLILLVLSVALFARFRGRHWFDDVVLVLPVVAFTVFTSALADDLGLRYLLPVYPLVFVFVSRVAPFFTRTTGRRAVATVLATWYVVGALWIYPDYLSYFNELIGGPGQGHKYLDDSNIDWGQDLKRVKTYADEHNIGTFKLFYIWNALPDYYGLNFERMPPQDFYGQPSPGIYIVSTHALIRGELIAKANGVNSDWLTRYKPIDRIGYGFYVFKF